MLETIIFTGILSGVMPPFSFFLIGKQDEQVHESNQNIFHQGYKEVVQLQLVLLMRCCQLAQGR